MGSQQEVKRVALLLDCAVQIFPLPFDLDAGFVHTPAPAHRTLVPAKRLLEQGHDLDDPAVHAGVIDLDAPFGHHFLKVEQTQRIRHIPAHTQQNHVQRIVQSLQYLLNAAGQCLVRRLRLYHHARQAVRSADSTPSRYCDTARRTAVLQSHQHERASRRKVTCPGDTLERVAVCRMQGPLVRGAMRQNLWRIAARRSA